MTRTRGRGGGGAAVRGPVAVRRSDGTILVRNAALPLVPMGEATAEPAWSIPLQVPTRTALDGGRIWLHDGSRVSSLDLSGAAPRLEPVPVSLGELTTTFAAGGGVLAVSRMDGFERSRVRLVPTAGGPALDPRVGGMVMQMAAVEQGFVVNAQQDYTTLLSLVKRDGSVWPLRLPGAPYRRPRSVNRFLVMGNDGALVLAASEYPGFRSVTLDGRILREVQVETGSVPFPEWEQAQDTWVRAVRFDFVRRRYVLCELPRLFEGPGGPAALHLFTADGAFLATVRIPLQLGDFEVVDGRVYAVAGRRGESWALNAYDLVLPAGAEEAAAEAFARAGEVPA